MRRTRTWSWSHSGARPREPDPSRAIPETPVPRLRHDQLGMIATHLAMTFPVWVRRRNTSYTFVDDSTIRLRQSVDFRLPLPEEFPASARPREGERIFVPLFVGTKDALAKFSLVDESGTALVLLNAGESASLAVAGMAAVVEGLSGIDGRPEADPAAARTALQEIATKPADEAKKAARTALGPTGALASVRTSDDIYRAHVDELARGMLMLVPVVYEPGRDRLLKMEHHSPQRTASNAPGRSAAARRLATVLTSLSIIEKRHDFEDLEVGWARSTHFSFEPPPDVRLNVARLDTEQWDPARGSRVRVPRRRQVFARPAMDLHVCPRAGFDAGEPDAGRRQQAMTELLQCRQDTGSIVLRMRPATASVMIPATFASLATTLALWLTGWRLGQLDGQTSAALLLLFPATAAAFLARSGEHAYATRLLRGVRWLTLAVAACAVLAVGVLGGGLVRADSTDAAVPSLVCTPRLPVLPPVTLVGVQPGLATLDCVGHDRPDHEAGVRTGARVAVLGGAVLATILTAILGAGVVVTHLTAHRRRTATDVENLDPVAATPATSATLVTPGPA